MIYYAKSVRYYFITKIHVEFTTAIIIKDINLQYNLNSAYILLAEILESHNIF